MSTTSQLFTRTIATALAAGAALAPAAAAQQDLRMPDTRDAAAELQPAPDLRMPDTRDAAREAADGRTAPVVEFVEIPAAGGFDWSDALVGAGGGVGVVLIGAGGALALVRVRRRPGVRSAH